MSERNTFDTQARSPRQEQRPRCRLEPAAVAVFVFLASAGLLVPQGTTIPNWWFSADPKKVVADPLFPTFSLIERKQILLQIDPTFAKMSSEKQDSYLWIAETRYLPKAPEPKTVFVWQPSDPNCTSEFAGGISRSLAKGIKASGLYVRASLERFREFAKSHIRISNERDETIVIRPQTFLLAAVKPKPLTLYFEYPSRVSYQLIKAAANYSPAVFPAERSVVRSGTGRTVATIDSPDQTAKREIEEMYGRVTQAALQHSATIMPNSLKECQLRAGQMVEGDVYFEGSDKTRDVILRVFLGDSAFEIPFSIPKR